MLGQIVGSGPDWVDVKWTVPTQGTLVATPMNICTNAKAKPITLPISVKP